LKNEVAKEEKKETAGNDVKVPVHYEKLMEIFNLDESSKD